MKSLEELAAKQWEDMQEQRLIISRLGGDLAREKRRFIELAEHMGFLVNAVSESVELFVNYEVELRRMLGDNRYEELFSKIDIVERVDESE